MDRRFFLKIFGIGAASAPLVAKVPLPTPPPLTPPPGPWKMPKVVPAILDKPTVVYGEFPMHDLPHARMAILRAKQAIHYATELFDDERLDPDAYDAGCARMRDVIARAGQRIKQLTGEQDGEEADKRRNSADASRESLSGDYGGHATTPTPIQGDEVRQHQRRDDTA